MVFILLDLLYPGRSHGEVYRGACILERAMETRGAEYCALMYMCHQSLVEYREA